MRAYDMLWSKDSRWFHFEDLVPVIHEDTPEEVKKLSKLSSGITR